MAALRVNCCLQSWVTRIKDRASCLRVQLSDTKDFPREARCSFCRQAAKFGLARLSLSACPFMSVCCHVATFRSGHVREPHLGALRAAWARVSDPSFRVSLGATALIISPVFSITKSNTNRAQISIIFLIEKTDGEASNCIQGANNPLESPPKIVLTVHLDKRRSSLRY